MKKLLTLLVCNMLWANSSPDSECVPKLLSLLHYRGQFELPLRGNNPDFIFDRAISQTSHWLVQHRSSIAPELPDLKPGGLWENGDRKLEVASHLLDTTKYWAARFTHPDAEKKGRQWETDIGLTLHPIASHEEEKRPRLAVHIATVQLDPVDKFKASTPPNPSVPRIASDLFFLEGLTPHSGTVPFSTGPKRLGMSDIPILLSDINSNSRRVPLILMPASDEGYFRISPTQLSQRLTGMSQIYLIPHQGDVYPTLRERLPEGYLSGPKGISVLWPGQKTYRHDETQPPLVLEAGKLEPLRDVELARFLAQNASYNQIPSPATDVRTVDDVSQFSQGRVPTPKAFELRLIDPNGITESSGTVMISNATHAISPSLMRDLNKDLHSDPFHVLGLNTSIREQIGVERLAEEFSQKGLLFVDLRKKKGLGYDFLVVNPRTGKAHKVELKTREEKGRDITFMRSEIDAAIQNPDSWILALVLFDSQKGTTQSAFFKKVPFDTGPSRAELKRTVEIEPYIESSQKHGWDSDVAVERGGEVLVPNDAFLEALLKHEGRFSPEEITTLKLHTLGVEDSK